MLGFLFKIVLVAAVVAIGGYFLFIKNPDAIKSVLSSKSELNVKSVLETKVLSNFKKVSAGALAENVSKGLDSLVTHNDSPVVLGIKISNDSLNSIIDFIKNLPPDQVNELKQVICAPVPTSTVTATPSPVSN